MRRIVIGLVFSTCVFTWSHADILHVPGDYSMIQAAINAAADGDTVLVAPGTYLENINFRGKNIVVASNHLFDRDPATIENTVIDGSSPMNPDTASCVIINSGEDSTAVLEGFTLTGGTGTKWIDEHGAGTYVEGGGIIIQYSSPTIRHNHIIGNEAIRVPVGVSSAGGGAIRVGDSTPRILNNIIMDNEGLYGGGIVLNYTGGTVKNNIIANNRVYPAAGSAPTFGGGGMWISGGFASTLKIIENNTVVGNSVSGTGGNGFAGRGGGILVASTTASIRNTIVWDNTQVTGGQIGTTMGGVASVSYSDVEEGYSGTGNINIDPMFTDTSYYLQMGSACVDSGNTAGEYNDPEDPGNPGFAEWPSMGGLRNDIGVYGGPGRSVLGTVVVSSVGEVPGEGLPQRFDLRQNYPNPFNPTTIIDYRLPIDNYVTLKVYDLLGREVMTLVNEKKTPGTYEVVWDAAGIASGVYLYRLRAGDFVQTRKLVVMK